MSTYAMQMEALAEGPPPRVRQRITPDTPVAGKRLTIYETQRGDGEWTTGWRGAGYAFWYDEEALRRWQVGHPVPEDADPHRARLFVPVCHESAYVQWIKTDHRPKVHEVPAYLVWIDE